MNYKHLLAITSVICTLVNPAYADWQYTKWGENLSSVLGKSGQNIEPTDDKEEHAEGKTFGLAKAKATYNASGTTFDVLFLFTDDKLNRVSLKIDNTKTAARLLSALGDQFGKPEQERSTPSSTCPSVEKIWRDTDNGNVIEFSGFDCGPGAANDYRIIYRPILKASETGL